jgi:hypothetical protein
MPDASPSLSGTPSLSDIRVDSFLAAHPIAIYKACNEAFNGSEWLGWEPETVLLELKNDVSDAAVDKLLAVQAVASNANAVVRSAAAFEKVVNAFNNNICIMDVIQPPEVEEMSYAVSQIELIIKEVHGPDTKIEYTDEVPGYVAGVAKFRGWFMLPRNLQFGQAMLNTLTGIVENSALYKEHKNIVDVVSNFVLNTSRKDARDILKDASIMDLETNDSASLMVKRVIGSLLFDPTLPYRMDSGTKS